MKKLILILFILIAGCHRKLTEIKEQSASDSSFEEEERIIDSIPICHSTDKYIDYGIVVNSDLDTIINYMGGMNGYPAGHDEKLQAWARKYLNAVDSLPTVQWDDTIQPMDTGRYRIMWDSAFIANKKRRGDQ